MPLDSLACYVAAAFALIVATAVLLRGHRAFASWCFAVGMTGMAIERHFEAMSETAQDAPVIQVTQTAALLASAFLPGIWLLFSLIYSRGNYRVFLRRSVVALLAAFVVPIAVALVYRGSLLRVLEYTDTPDTWWVSFLFPAKALNVLLLGSSILILMNLERTFRSAVGTMQWRIKFVVLGLAVIFGARIYTQTQALIFSGHALSLTTVETGALIVGCIFIAVGHLRTGFGEIDVYPSGTVLHTSLTLLLAGAYLFVVGILAQVVSRFGGANSFQIQALLILIGIAILAVLLLSQRFRQSLRTFVSRHFRRPEHDFRQIWTRFTQTMARVVDETELCAASANLMSQTFHVLSVSLWVFDERNHRLLQRASTAASTPDDAPEARNFQPPPMSAPGAGGLPAPFDLEKAKGALADSLRELTSTQFRTGGNRLCVPLTTADRWLGAAVLADRVNGVPYTVEELDLLKCIGDQVAAGLSNLQLTGEILRTKEVEAFQNISAFFVHDLKNAASTLSLMLQNLPIHFDDPEFRADALRGIGNTVTRIDQLISRLSVLRRKLEIQPAPVDLNAVVAEALESFAVDDSIRVIKELTPLPKVAADREQLHSVVTNLLLNARDALETGGEVRVETSQNGPWASLSVTDNGCGMTATFLRDSLFRPFSTTKKKGLGIGMFQSKMIIEAHRGNIQVESEPGTGSVFRVLLPLANPAE